MGGALMSPEYAEELARQVDELEAENEKLRTTIESLRNCLQEIYDAGEEWGGMCCSVHAWLNLGELRRPKGTLIK
jgi:hypothetical protein